MAAEHKRRAVLEQKIRQLALLGGGGGRVFLSPVHKDRDGVRVGLTGACKVAFQQLIVDFAAVCHVISRKNIDAVRMLILRQAVRAVGIGEDGETDAADVDDLHRVALLLRAVGADMVETGAVEHIERARQAGKPGVQTVIARGREQIKADALEVACKLVGRAELRKP